MLLEPAQIMPCHLKSTPSSDELIQFKLFRIGSEAESNRVVLAQLGIQSNSNRTLLGKVSNRLEACPEPA